MFAGGDSSELDKLKREMGILNRMNEDQQKRLDEQRSVLKRRNEDATELDRRIEELTNRLRQKKLASSQASAVATPSSRMHTIVAAVEPLVKKAEPNLKVGRFFQFCVCVCISWLYYLALFCRMAWHRTSALGL